MLTTSARLVAATCLVLTGLLSAVSVMLQPGFAAGPSDRLAVIDGSGAPGTISLLTFVLAQLPFLVAVVAMALLARAASPRLSVMGGALAVIGGFGHAVFGGIGLAYLAMSSDVTHRAAMAEVIARVESGPALAFMASGLLGTVLGLFLLGIALFWSGAVARWIPWALWAFLVMEFVISNFAEWAVPAAVLLYVAAFGAIAAQLVRGNVTDNEQPHELVVVGSAVS